MFHEPVMADLALRLTQQHIHSATPDAPVIEHRSRRRLLKPRGMLRSVVRAGVGRTAPAPVARPAGQRTLS
jgi:hypothetical protein